MLNKAIEFVRASPLKLNGVYFIPCSFFEALILLYYYTTLHRSHIPPDASSQSQATPPTDLSQIVNIGFSVVQEEDIATTKDKIDVHATCLFRST
jgi:hypothetical protein